MNAAGAGISKNALKKLAKAQRKAALKEDKAKQAAKLELVHFDGNVKRGYTGAAAGKPGRAREARELGLSAATVGPSQHRARGGAPVNIDNLPQEQQRIVAALEELEKAARIKSLPHLAERAPLPMDCHGSLDCRPEEEAGSAEDPCFHSLRSAGLRQFPDLSCALNSLTGLDLSRNELFSLPGLEVLSNLKSLNLSRNWFEVIPSEIGSLSQLERLVLNHNMLKPSWEALQIEAIR